MMEFRAFLATKSQSYDNINRFRAGRIYHKFSEIFGKKQIVQIIGTNGKGSTGRFLAQILCEAGFSVGHFTSPHIFDFNERFWLNGKNLNDNALNAAHIALSRLLKEDLNSLSYFEYATFLAFLALKKCDFLIFEAGLGGEFDATSVFEKELSLFTPISRDHTQILGDTITEISRTKLKAMCKNAIIADTQEKQSFEIAEKIALLKGANLFRVSEIFNEIPAEIQAEFSKYAKKFALPKFLQENLKHAICAAKFLLNSRRNLGESKNISILGNLNANLLKAITNLKKLDLKGRCQEIAPNLFIDVGHNEAAARAILAHFKALKINKITLIYNAFLDKDIRAILAILKPIIAKISVFEYESDRKLGTNEIKSAAKALNITCESFKELKNSEINLVFGSFMLVENFVRFYKNSRKI